MRRTRLAAAVMAAVAAAAAAAIVVLPLPPAAATAVASPVVTSDVSGSIEVRDPAAVVFAARFAAQAQPAPRPPAAGDEVTFTFGSWAFVMGVALCAIAVFALTLGTATSWAPRIRGIAHRRALDLSGAAVRAEAFGETVLRRGGGHARVGARLEEAGLDIRPGELFVATASGGLVLLAVGWAIGGPVVGIVMAASSPLVTRLVLDQLARRRRSKFDSQLADTLELMAGSLRAGHGLAQAVDTVAKESESPTSEEFQRVTIETRLGRDFVESLSALAARTRSDDFSWVVQAIEIQREVGGDLAEVLDTVRETIRDRIRVRRQVSALSAEGRLSAWVLMVLPFGLGGMVAATNPNFMDPLFTTGTGHVLLGTGAVLMVVGGVWLRKIVKPVF